MKGRHLGDELYGLCFYTSILTVTVSNGFDGTCNRPGRKTQWKALHCVNQALQCSEHKELGTILLFCACRNFVQEIRVKAVMVIGLFYSLSYFPDYAHSVRCFGTE